MSESRRLLTKSEILRQTALPRRWVPTPEWANGEPDAGVWVRGMSGRERDEYEARKADVFRAAKEADAKVDRGTFRAELVAACVVTDDGTQVFDETDVNALAALSAAPLDRIVDAVCEMSRIGIDADKAIRKNSSSGPGDGGS